MNRSSRFLFQHCFTGAEAALTILIRKARATALKSHGPRLLDSVCSIDHFNAFFFQHLHDPCHILAAHTFFVFRAESHMDGLHAFLFHAFYFFMPSSSSGSFPQPLQRIKAATSTSIPLYLSKLLIRLLNAVKQAAPAQTLLELRQFNIAIFFIMYP